MFATLAKQKWGQGGPLGGDHLIVVHGIGFPLAAWWWMASRLEGDHVPVGSATACQSNEASFQDSLSGRLKCGRAIYSTFLAQCLAPQSIRNPNISGQILLRNSTVQINLLLVVSY